MTLIPIIIVLIMTSSKILLFAYAIHLCWLLIRLCSKSGKAFFIDKNSKRITRCDRYIHSQIEFEPINSKRLYKKANKIC